MKFIVTIATAVLLLNLVGCSDPKVEDSPAQRKVFSTEAAQLILSSGTFDALINQAVDQGSQMFAARMHPKLGRELTQTEYEKVKSAFREAFIQTYPAKAWEAPFAELYGKHFNAPELDQLLKFYKTPAGIKLLQKQGTLSTEGAQIGVRLVESKSEEFEKTFMRELDKR